jgi:shikimate 5-dehydrogenase
VAKRVRTETALGAGEMAEAAAKGLGRGAKAVRMCNRSFDRGAALARTFGGIAAPWEASEATGMAVTDSQCGYTALSRAACEQLDLDALWPTYGYPNDLLATLVKRHFALRRCQ